MENINIGIRSLKGEIYKITVNTSDTVIVGRLRYKISNNALVN
jgi:hypothetical protein